MAINNQFNNNLANCSNLPVGGITAGGTPSAATYLDGSGNWSQPPGIGAFPSGTRMTFQQTSAPTGWTKDVTAAINNGALRTVTGGAGTGGYVPFTTAFTGQTPSGSVGFTTLTTAQIPAHTHPVGVTVGGAQTGGGNNSAGGGSSITSGANAGGGGSHNHTFTGNLIDFNVAYYDVIIAQKN